MLKRTLPAVAAALLVVSSPARADTLTALNAARAAAGAPPLRADPRLARAARAHSRDMVARRYFAHVTPAGSTLSMRVARSGWTHGRRRWRVGETLAWGSGPLASPDAIVAAWLNSPAHRRIALARRWRVVGIGVASGTPFATPGATFTADFGT